ncbi:MAG: DUF1836 domain-containing protein [Anaerovorax sp.]
MRYEEYVKNTIEEFIEKGAMSKSEFPEMELYMDQAAGFMDKKLEIYKEDAKEPVITKTMIGNYVKNKMLPRPNNKKYNKDHLIFLTFIYYLKNPFQMGDIVDNYNAEFEEKIDLSMIYDGVGKIQEQARETLLQDTMDDIAYIKKQLNKSDVVDDDILEMFMLIVDLSMKANFERFLAQKLLNEYFAKPKKKK